MNTHQNICQKVQLSTQITKPPDSLTKEKGGYFLQKNDIGVLVIFNAFQFCQ